MCSTAQDLEPSRQARGRTNLRVRTLSQHSPFPLEQASDADTQRQSRAVVVVGGGVSGIWAALTLVEQGYTNVTIIEKEMRVGGKAAAFEHEGKHFPLGAVGTPLALEEASFAESKLFERPLRFGASLLGRTGRRQSKAVQWGAGAALRTLTSSPDRSRRQSSLLERVSEVKSHLGG